MHAAMVFEALSTLHRYKVCFNSSLGYLQHLPLKTSIMASAAESTPAPGRKLDSGWALVWCPKWDQIDPIDPH